MQQKFLFSILCFLPMAVSAADLLADEQGPTAPEAVVATTANADFLLPSYTVPSETPDTTAPVPSEVDILNEIFGTPDPVPVATRVVAEPAQRTFSPRTGVQTTDELLTPLPPLPMIRTEPVIEPKNTFFTQPKLADKALAAATVPASGLGMPSEIRIPFRKIRITFYPNQTAFSAQALKWAKSFAVRVVNDPRLLAEIRVSEENWKIQEKRLTVLLQILKEAGVSAHQIRVYKSARSKDSILMGYTYNPEYMLPGNGKIKQERTQKTIDW